MTLSPITLIALSGLAGAGKDAGARLLAEDGWQRLAFGDKVREVALAIDPVVAISLDERPVRLAALVDSVGWEVAKRDYPEVRRLLQRIGTEGGRNVLGANVWVDATLRDLPGLAVVTDCRFPNEADAVRDRGGVVLRIERPGLEPLRDEHGRIHLSETALDGYQFDAVIRNHGTLDELGGLLRKAVVWLATIGR